MSFDMHGKQWIVPEWRTAKEVTHMNGLDPTDVFAAKQNIKHVNDCKPQLRVWNLCTMSTSLNEKQTQN